MQAETNTPIEHCVEDSTTGRKIKLRINLGPHGLEVILPNGEYILLDMSEGRLGVMHLDNQDAQWDRLDVTIPEQAEQE